MSWSMTAEPSVAEVEPGALLMYMRTDWGRLFKSWSFDNGEIWSAPTATPLSASGAPGQIKTIPGTGDLLVVWSQESPEEMKRGLIRNRLSSAVSRTNGSIWEHFQNVDSTLEGAQVEPGPVGFTGPRAWWPGPLSRRRPATAATSLTYPTTTAAVPIRRCFSGGTVFSSGTPMPITTRTMST